MRAVHNDSSLASCCVIFRITRGKQYYSMLCKILYKRLRCHVRQTIHLALRQSLVDASESAK